MWQLPSTGPFTKLLHSLRLTRVVSQTYSPYMKLPLKLRQVATLVFSFALMGTYVWYSGHGNRFVSHKAMQASGGNVLPGATRANPTLPSITPFEPERDLWPKTSPGLKFERTTTYGQQNGTLVNANGQVVKISRLMASSKVMVTSLLPGTNTPANTIIIGSPPATSNSTPALLLSGSKAMVITSLLPASNSPGTNAPNNFLNSVFVSGTNARPTRLMSSSKMGVTSLMPAKEGPGYSLQLVTPPPATPTNFPGGTFQFIGTNLVIENSMSLEPQISLTNKNVR